MSVPETIPAWRVSRSGDARSVNHNVIIGGLLTLPAYLLSLSPYTKNGSSYIARSAVVGRYANYPGYTQREYRHSTRVSRLFASSVRELT